MNSEHNRRIGYLVGLIVAIVLIIAGGFMSFYTVNKYEKDILNMQDEQLVNLLDSSDYRLNGIMERFRRDLEYTVDRRPFKRGEALWLNGGGSGVLMGAMSRCTMTNSDWFKTMLVVRDGEIVLSSDGNREYGFSGDPISEDILICTSLNGDPCLAFEYKSSAGVSYMAVMDLKKLYSHIVNKDYDSDDTIMLLDSSGQIILHQEEASACIDYVTSADKISDKTGMEFLVDCQKTGERGKKSYERTINEVDINSGIADETGEDGQSSTDEDSNSPGIRVPENTTATYSARMVVRPSDKTKNRIFAIAVTTNDDEMITLFRSIVRSLVIYLCLAALGFILIVINTISIRRQNVQVSTELQALQEKNRATEELNKKTQQLAHHQRLEAIGTLTSSIAHEFNNLLTPIMGYSLITLETLNRENKENSELYDDILEIYNSSCKAKDMIARLSELSRKGSSNIMKNISPAELAEKVLNVTAPALPKKVDIVRDYEEMDAQIHGNETQLSQLLLNLVLNAFQAMERDGGTLTVGVYQHEDETVFELVDTGPGISPEDLPHIFEPFFTTKGVGKGTGLGLAIAAQAAEDHGGKITVESDEDKGCIFKVHIPLNKA